MNINLTTNASSRGTMADESALKCCWMLAGVVSYKLCGERYECETCSFDHAIRNRRMRLFADPASGHPASNEIAAESLLFHPRHVWARVEAGGRIRTGLDDFGRRLMGRIYCVQLPEPGTRIAAGTPAWKVVHHEGEISLASPVSGVVEEVNERLRTNPTLVNTDSYGDGWAMVINPLDLSGDLRNLRFGAETASWSAAEFERLVRELDGLGGGSGPGHPRALTAGPGPTLMDGGRLVENLHETIPSDARARVLDLFLSATESNPSGAPESRSPGGSEGS